MALCQFLTGSWLVTMSQWQNGKDGEDENRDRMSSQGLRAVSENLCHLLDGKIAFEQALELWQHAETEDFAHALWQPHVSVDRGRARHAQRRARSWDRHRFAFPPPYGEGAAHARGWSAERATRQ